MSIILRDRQPLSAIVVHCVSDHIANCFYSPPLFYLLFIVQVFIGVSLNRSACFAISVRYPRCEKKLYISALSLLFGSRFVEVLFLEIVPQKGKLVILMSGAAKYLTYHLLSVIWSSPRHPPLVRLTTCLFVQNNPDGGSSRRVSLTAAGPGLPTRHHQRPGGAGH